MITLRKQTLFLALTILFYIKIPYGQILTTTASDPAISIDGNAELAAAASDGDGTQAKPYLIANYTIATSTSHGVDIRNTNKHFILRNVTVDGTGSSSKYGFFFYNVTNGTIENCRASHWQHGVFLWDSNYNTLTNNAASTNNNGFFLYNSSDNTVTSNTASNNSNGFNVADSSNFTTFTSNTASNNSYGFSLTSSSHNTFTSNVASNNSRGFNLWKFSDNTFTSNTASNNTQRIQSEYTYGFYLGFSNHNTWTGNIASNNDKGFCLYNASDNMWTGNIAYNNGAEGFYMYDSSNFNTWIGNIAYNNSQGFYQNDPNNFNTWISNNATNNDAEGFYMASSSHNTWINNNASKNTRGFVLFRSSNNTWTNNRAISNNYYGFYLQESSNNTWTNNRAISSRNFSGVYMQDSNNNTWTGSTVSNNNQNGFRLVSSSHNTWTGNTVSNNNQSGFSLQESNNNTWTGNTVSNNDYGIKLENSSNNLLYMNSIWLNNFQAFSDSANTWHNGTHGNYWGDYTGFDSNNDSIGDTPYSIGGEGDNEDPYPLMYDPIRDLYRPSAPQNLAGTLGGTAREEFVALTWTAPTADGGSAITGYHIYRSTSSGAGYAQIGSSSARTFSDTTVSNGITYFYVVRAINAIGESPASNEIHAAIPSMVPTAPQSLQATGGNGFVELVWTTPTSDGGAAISEYHIYRSTSSGAGYTQLGVSFTTRFNDTTVVNDVTYYYVVRAINRIGASFASNEAAATPFNETAPTKSSEESRFSGTFSFFGLISLSLGILYIRRSKNT
ncbi:MAG: NosD domain-containing protein [Candidatus Thorarchaeota archaeon]